MERDPSGWPETTRPTGQHYTVAALLHLEHAAPHLLELIEPIGYGSEH